MQKCLQSIINVISISTNEIKTGPPDREELIATIKKLKNGKAANDIPADYIKCALSCDSMLTEMVKMYEKVWETNEYCLDSNKCPSMH